MRPGAARAATLPKAAALCCTALVLLLPTLFAMRAVGAPPAAGELERLERIVRGQPPGERLDTGGARLFHRAAVATEAWPAAAEAQRALLVRARLSQVAGVTALAWLTYLMTLLAGGRLQALLACAALALAPPVREAGYVLRAETAGALFAMLSVLLLQFAARPRGRERGHNPRRAAAVGGGLMVCAAVAIAMACEASPSLGESLLVPGVVLLLAAVQLALRGRRLLARRGLIGVPVRAINRRLIPWTALGFLAPAVALWVQRKSYTVAVDALEVAAPQSALLPQSPAGYGVAAALLVCGAVAWIARLGVRFGRCGRVSPDLVLFSACAVFLLGALQDEVPRDPLPLAPAAAVVVGTGLRAVLALALGALARRGR